MPDGTKKRYRVRMVEADTPTDDNMAVVVEHDPMEMEEIEIDENDPEDAKYDPKVRIVCCYNYVLNSQ